MFKSSLIFRSMGILLITFLTLYLAQKLFFTPKNTIDLYYEILQNQERIVGGEKIDDSEVLYFSDCGKNPKCFESYFEKYNKTHTLEQSFSHLSLLMRRYPNYQKFCHRISHGIAHTEYDKVNGDINYAAEEFIKGEYFKNISTCAGGYFHGLLEEASLEIRDESQLVNFLKNIYSSTSTDPVFKTRFVHGVGHAAYLQMGLNVEKSIGVCDSLIQSDFGKFDCYTGIFMEMNNILPSQKIVIKINETFVFPICDSLGNFTARDACQFESSLQLKNFINSPVYGQSDYSEVIKLCQKLPTPLERLICVKSISIRSISESGVRNVEKMCIDNTVTRPERIYCMVGFASRMAQSISTDRNKTFFGISSDICKRLGSVNEYLKCRDIIYYNPINTYYVNSEDLKL